MSGVARRKSDVSFRPKGAPFAENQPGRQAAPCWGDVQAKSFPDRLGVPGPPWWRTPAVSLAGEQALPILLPGTLSRRALSPAPAAGGALLGDSWLESSIKQALRFLSLAVSFLELPRVLSTACLAPRLAPFLSSFLAFLNLGFPLADRWSGNTKEPRFSFPTMVQTQKGAFF